nr:MAG TPA: homing endonuclease [Caudoviricetes sp.]
MTWKKIRLCDNYSINELGDVRNDITGKMKKPFINKATGYLTVDLWKDNKPLKVTIHRLLAEAFIPNPSGKLTVDHKDGNRLNNSLENLRWATYAEQNSRFGVIGVRSERIKVTHYAEKREKRGGGHEAWLDVDDVMYFDRITDAANYFGLTIGAISLLLKNGTIGRRGKTRGYRFEYVSGKRVTIS